MADEKKSNLEPIEDADLDLKRKFTGGGGEPQTFEKPSAAETIPETDREAVPERKEGAAEKDAAYSNILAKVKTQAPPVDEVQVKQDAQIAHAEKDPETKIATLVNLAMHKGVVHAVKVAKHLEDNYALDEFHDRLLAEELHDALVKKGLIEEI